MDDELILTSPPCCSNYNRTSDDDGEPITNCPCVCHVEEES